MEEIPRLGDKQPYEEYYISFDFTEYLDSATISSATVTALDITADPDSDVSTTLINSTKQKTDAFAKIVYVWVRAGTAEHEYQITCKVVASDGSKYELDAILPVTEF